MSTGPVEQIAFRSSIAAVNHDNHLRVYSQDVLGGVRESLYEGAWNGGVNALSTSKLDSPLAATSKGLERIRLYYISTDNKLREYAYDAGANWYDGGLNKSNFAVAAYSQIAATALLPNKNKDFTLRVYVQVADNTIQEYGYDNPSSGWQKMSNLGAALPGTSIAATSFVGQAGLSIRVYFQKQDLSITELAYDNNKPWYTGGFTIPSTSTTPRASLAATNFNDTPSSISIRVYYSSPNNSILEKGYDGKGWYDGGFDRKVIPGSKVAVLSWEQGGQIQIRVYAQRGVSVTAVSEWTYGPGGWAEGRNGLPPA